MQKTTLQKIKFNKCMSYGNEFMSVQCIIKIKLTFTFSNENQICVILSHALQT